MAVEDRLLYFSKEVTRCIKDPTVVSHLEADGIISSDESSKLKKIYLDGDPFKANEEMIDCLLKSTAKGKWRSFLDALEKSDYLYIKSLLESTDRQRTNDEREKEIIRVFIPYLEKTVIAMEILSELYSRKVINEMDNELIRLTYQNKGDTYATIVLLERMQCRLAPDEWFYEFLSALVKRNLCHVVKEIEPDFLKCPDRFRPCTDALKSKGTKCGELNLKHDRDVTECVKDGEVICNVSSCVIEHVATDYGKVEEDVDKEVQNQIETDDDADGQGTFDLSRNSTLIYVRDGTATGQSVTHGEETEKKTILSEVVTLGERAPPEGHDIDGNSSSDDGNTQNTNNTSTTSKIEYVEQKENVLQTDTADSVTTDSANETEESDDSADETTDEPLAKKLYPFQLELAENAYAGKNTIICAPTGSGKTWVALYIIDSHLQSSTNGKNKVVFMARNGALVKQQMDFISMQLPYARVKHLKGDTDEAMMLNAFLDDNDIFLFTPQILFNNLNTDVKTLSVFSLMVLDECHHTKGAEPYNMLMKHYLMEKENRTSNLPQIIGLTASIGTGNAKSQKDALDHIFRVCASLDVRCLSTVEKNRDDLAKHVSVPSEESIQMKMRSYDPCRSILLEAVKETSDFLQDMALMEPKMIQVMHKCPKDVESRRYVQWLGEIINAAESLTRGQGRNIASCAKYLQIYINALEINRLLRIQNVAVYLATQHAEEVEHTDSFTKKETCLLNKLKEIQKELFKLNTTTENPNVHVIGKILTDLFVGKDSDANSRAMVFVHARATCRALSDFLNEELEQIYVKASPFLGKDTRGTDKGMTEDDQTSILEEFREGTYKVLVATSVGMEGLDVPDCNMTLNYNFNGDEITKIQMTGRSRKKKGKAVMIATDTQLDKDRIAMYRIKLMTGAVEEFKKLDGSSINREISTIQKKLLDDYKWQLETKELKSSKQSNEIDYKILCRKCNVFICNASDIRKLETSHLVAVRGFEENIRKEDVKRVNMGPLKKKYKMYCKACPKYWGVIAENNNIEYYILKSESLKFVSRICEEDVKTYEKWTQMPYKFKELGIMDLSHLYDEAN